MTLDKRWVSHKGSYPRRQTFTTQGHKRLYHGSTNGSVPEANILKNNSTLVSVPINHSIKFGFVSVNGPKETYFVDMLHIFTYYTVLIVGLFMLYALHRMKCCSINILNYYLPCLRCFTFVVDLYNLLDSHLHPTSSLPTIAVKDSSRVTTFWSGTTF